jgi:fusaric acid resistance family protein
MAGFEAQRSPERPGSRRSGSQVSTAVVEFVVLAVACLVTYWLATHLLSWVHSVGRDDDLLGGMWAALATIFVLRDSFGKSVAAAVSRMVATSVSFVLCLSYLAFLPFHAWALAVLVGASALAVMLLGRPGDAVTAGITTAVIMVVAAVSPQHACSSPSSGWRTPSSASPSARWPPRPARRSRSSSRLDPPPPEGQDRFIRTDRGAVVAYSLPPPVAGEATQKAFPKKLSDSYSISNADLIK